MGCVTGTELRPLKAQVRITPREITRCKGTCSEALDTSLWFSQHLWLTPGRLTILKEAGAPCFPAAPALCALSSPWFSVFWMLQTRGVTQYRAFCVWLRLLSLMFSRFTHVAMCNGQFLWLHSIQTTLGLSVHPLADFCAIPTFWPL